MSPFSILIAIASIGLLMIVHEAGHHFIARAFGLRVTKFSIGFGPTIWRHQPKNSPTVYQVAIIPFFAFVQIAGMNPFEENEADDKGSFSNASLTARAATLLGGPIANYCFAAIAAFIVFWGGGHRVYTAEVNVAPESAAAVAGLKDGDIITQIDGKSVEGFEDIYKRVGEAGNGAMHVDVKRKQEALSFDITPKLDEKSGRKLLGVGARNYITEARPAGESLKQALLLPADVVYQMFASIGRILTFRESPQVSGPLGMGKMIGQAAERGILDYLWIVTIISASLAGMNLIPFPGLDGGRLMFVGYEAIARRKPDQTLEAKIHATGMLLLLAVMIVVTFNDARSKESPVEEAAKKNDIPTPVEIKKSPGK